ncbi:MAG: hypothetical protein RL660_2475 [Bacteroidota bacterium]|jgi:four helix bundle protein
MEDQKQYLTLNSIEAYTSAFKLSNKVWDVVAIWENFARQTIGKQFVRAIDSISANIAEGFGRFHKREKVQFYRIAKASAVESLDWNQKAKTRNLLNESDYNFIFAELKELPRLINTLIKFTNDKLKH